MIDNHQLFGLGIGYVDAHLLAATMLTTDARLWMRDKRRSRRKSDSSATTGVPPKSVRG
jgi:hypothetical protein